MFENVGKMIQSIVEQGEFKEYLDKKYGSNRTEKIDLSEAIGGYLGNKMAQNILNGLNNLQVSLKR